MTRPSNRGNVNGLAVASLVSAFIIFPLGAVLGLAARSQIKQTGETGKGLAIGGIVVGAVNSLSCALAVAFLFFLGDKLPLGAGVQPGQPATSASSSTAPGGGVGTSLDRLKVGQCLNGIHAAGEEVRTLPVVACDVAHEGEVVSTFDLTGSTFPGDSAIRAQAEEKCLAQLDTYSPSTRDDQTIRLVFAHPSQSDWTQGGRKVICIARFDTPRQGSIKG